MELHIGTKAVNAVPMTRQEYNDLRNWALPVDEDGTDEGYLVEYLDGGKPNTDLYDGYVSWSPAEQFNNAYKPSGSLTFGDAIHLSKLGYKLARKGWNGSGMFIYYVPEASYKACTAIMKEMGHTDDLVPYRAYIALKTAQDDIATWSPSTSDALAEDWVIVK